MTVSAKTLRLLMAAGLEGEALLGVVESIETDCQKPARSSSAERQARYRDRKRNESDVTGDVTAPLDKESTPKPPKEINPPKENPPKGGQKKGVAAVLSAVISQATAEAVIEHRKRIRKPMTEHAASLLAQRLSEAPQAGFTPDQAADLMIEKGWQSIEIDWLQKSAPPVSVRPVEDEKRWQTRLNFARREGRWSTPEWGPMPSQPGCRVPRHLIQAGDGKDWTETERERAA